MRNLTPHWASGRGIGGVVAIVTSLVVSGRGVAQQQNPSTTPTPNAAVGPACVSVAVQDSLWARSTGAHASVCVMPNVGIIRVMVQMPPDPKTPDPQGSPRAGCIPNKTCVSVHSHRMTAEGIGARVTLRPWAPGGSLLELLSATGSKSLPTQSSAPAPMQGRFAVDSFGTWRWEVAVQPGNVIDSIVVRRNGATAKLAPSVAQMQSWVERAIKSSAPQSGQSPQTGTPSPASKNLSRKSAPTAQTKTSPTVPPAVPPTAPTGNPRLPSVRTSSDNSESAGVRDECQPRPMQWKLESVRGQWCQLSGRISGGRLLITEPTAQRKPPDSLAVCGQRSTCVQLVLRLASDTTVRWRLATDWGRTTPMWERQLTQKGPWEPQLVGKDGLPARLRGGVGDAPTRWTLEFEIHPDWQIDLIRVDGSQHHETLATPASRKISQGGEPPGWSGEMHLLSTTPTPLTADRQGRIAVGVTVNWGTPALGVSVSLFPVPVLPPLLELRAEPNRRFPRITPDARPDMQQWRTAPGSYLWMDTWQVDRQGASARAGTTVAGIPVVIGGALNGVGGPSMWAVRAGGPRLRLQVGALRTTFGVGADVAFRPWAQAATMELATNGWAPDSTLRETVTDTAVLSRRPVASRWKARTSLTQAFRQGDIADGSGAARLELDGPLTRRTGITLLHERLGANLSNAGMVLAPWDGIQRTEILLRHPGYSSSPSNLRDEYVSQDPVVSGAQTSLGVPTILETPSSSIVATDDIGPRVRTKARWGWDTRLSRVGVLPTKSIWETGWNAPQGDEWHLQHAVSYTKKDGRLLRATFGADKFNYQGLPSSAVTPQMTFEAELPLGKAGEGNHQGIIRKTGQRSAGESTVTSAEASDRKPSGNATVWVTRVHADAFPYFARSAPGRNLHGRSGLYWTRQSWRAVVVGELGQSWQCGSGRQGPLSIDSLGFIFIRDQPARLWSGGCARVQTIGGGQIRGEWQSQSAGLFGETVLTYDLISSASAARSRVISFRDEGNSWFENRTQQSLIQGALQGVRLGGWVAPRVHGRRVRIQADTGCWSQVIRQTCASAVSARVPLGSFSQ